jgi:hypothetical protein
MWMGREIPEFFVYILEWKGLEGGEPRGCRFLWLGVFRYIPHWGEMWILRLRVVGFNAICS